jgi:hypothetical protein
MNTTTNQTQIETLTNSIASLIESKGTCFAGFTYKGKRRNLTLGANLRNKVAGVGNWGESTSKGAIIKHKGNYYLQGIPNNDTNFATIKRFKMNEVENLIVG